MSVGVVRDLSFPSAKGWKWSQSLFKLPVALLKMINGWQSHFHIFKITPRRDSFALLSLSRK